MNSRRRRNMAFVLLRCSLISALLPITIGLITGDLNTRRSGEVLFYVIIIYSSFAFVGNVLKFYIRPWIVFVIECLIVAVLFSFSKGSLLIFAFLAINLAAFYLLHKWFNRKEDKKLWTNRTPVN